jgi:tRNA (guanine6-N2)-methyltransferase
VAEGLEAIARDELQRRFGDRVKVLQQGAAPGVISFLFTGDPRGLLKLQTVQAVHLLRRFPVSRPKALLGDEHFRALLAMIHAARGLFAPGEFRTLYLNAAGSDSTVMMRLKQELAARSGMEVGADEGDLMIRVRPSRGEERGERREGGGWDVLVRLSPRPLATRAWRVCNFEGALNAPVAHAMALLTRPAPRDVFVNLACGSGTLLVERLAAAPAAVAIGCDLDARALACARDNLAAFGAAIGAAPGATAGRRAELWQADARRLPLRDGCVDALCADLPFGHLMGSHAQNVATYPLILAEAARVARAGARFALITHEVRLMESLLGIGRTGDSTQPGTHPSWRCEQVLRVELGGLMPRIFVLRRIQT